MTASSVTIAPYVVTVEFVLHSAAIMAEFRALIDDNARQSCAGEPGCRRFDVLAPKGRADAVFLYEIYDSRAAFEDHLMAAHYHLFDKASAAMVLRKVVQEFTLECEGSHPQAK